MNYVVDSKGMKILVNHECFDATVIFESLPALTVLHKTQNVPQFGSLPPSDHHPHPTWSAAS